MSSSHSEKYVTKLLFGFGAVIAAIFAIVYAAFEKTKTGDWYFWGVVASVLMCTGLYLLVSASVHKVKSELSRRQKGRELQKTSPTDDN